MKEKTALFFVGVDDDGCPISVSVARQSGDQIQVTATGAGDDVKRFWDWLAAGNDDENAEVPAESGPIVRRFKALAFGLADD